MKTWSNRARVNNNKFWVYIFKEHSTQVCNACRRRLQQAIAWNLRTRNLHHVHWSTDVLACHGSLFVQSIFRKFLSAANVRGDANVWKWRHAQVFIWELNASSFPILSHWHLTVLKRFLVNGGLQNRLLEGCSWAGTARNQNCLAHFFLSFSLTDLTGNLALRTNIQHSWIANSWIKLVTITTPLKPLSYATVIISSVVHANWFTAGNVPAAEKYRYCETKLTSKIIMETRILFV